MKDFLNFQITSKAEGDKVRHTIRHRKRDNLVVEFTTSVSTAAAHIPDLVQGVMKAWVNKYMKANRKSLSAKQKKFYDTVVWFYKEERRAPSHEEMCDLMGWRSKGTSFHYTKRLIAAGWFWPDEDGRVIPIDIAAPDLTE